MIYATAASVTVFLILFFIMKIGIIMAFIFSAAVYAGVLLITSSQRKKIAEPFSSADFIKNLDRKIGEIKSFSGRVTDETIKSCIHDICSELGEISSNMKKDPSDLKNGRNTLLYYVDTTLKILSLYSDLKGKKVLDENMKSTIAKTEVVIKQIRGVLMAEHSKLLENDFLNLDTEIKVLENTIKYEGRGS